MSDRHDIDAILRDWPYQPGAISARLVRTQDGREVLQMRIEMGLLQMETTGRPDGKRPHGEETYLDYLIGRVVADGQAFILSEADRLEVDREFLQFYHRRICCLALREFRRAVADADHTLALMEFVAAHSLDENWALSHQQYRPFVLFHRTQASAMLMLHRSGPETAIEEINRGLDSLQKVFATAEAEEQFDQDELVGQLNQMKESLREEYRVGRTLTEQLSDAIAAEEYERAAVLRDQIARRGRRR